MCITIFLFVFYVTLEDVFPCELLFSLNGHPCFFQTYSPLQTRSPDQLADMMNALLNELHNWEMILIGLQVPVPRIRSIQKENRDDYMRMAAGLNT